MGGVGGGSVCMGGGRVCVGRKCVWVECGRTNGGLTIEQKQAPQNTSNVNFTLIYSSIQLETKINQKA